jgi:probable HAF family extracellular repeat protein
MDVPISWIGGVPTVLSLPLGATGCQAIDVNEPGQIFGYCSDGNAYVWPSATAAPIALLPLTPGGWVSAFKINNLGHVIGVSPTSTGDRHAVLWTDPTSPPEDLGSLGLSCSDCNMATALNDNDQAVGVGWTGNPAVDGPVLIGNHTLTPLGMPANQDCGPAFPYDMNNAGQVIAGTIIGTPCLVLWTITGSPSTPQQQIQTISTQVQGLVSSGTLTSGEGNALQVKLDAALASLGQSGSTTTTNASASTSASQKTGNTTAACNKLQAFVNQVQAYVNSGRLTTAESQPLITAANGVTTKLCG